jgi:hypothetical protein
MLFAIKKHIKNKKDGGEGSLPSSLHFCQHLEAPLAFVVLKLWVPPKLCPHS